MLAGNFFLIGCCGFYLAWWLLAFKPTGAVKGIKSGWLLLPALFLGVMAIVQIVRGCGEDFAGKLLFAQRYAIFAGIAAYAVLLGVTYKLLGRPVTTELLLIALWCVLTVCELNALYALGCFSKSGTVGAIVFVLIAAVISLVCYLLYYSLDAQKGYIDGMVPLILAGVIMAGISVKVLI